MLLISEMESSKCSLSGFSALTLMVFGAILGTVGCKRAPLYARSSPSRDDHRCPLEGRVTWWECPGDVHTPRCDVSMSLLVQPTAQLPAGLPRTHSPLPAGLASLSWGCSPLMASSCHSLTSCPGPTVISRSLPPDSPQ